MRKIRCPRCHGNMLVVTDRNCNHSAFNGWRRTPSDYSAILCVSADCRRSWRSKAPGVANVPDGTHSDNYESTPEGYARYLHDKKGIPMDNNKEVG